MNFSFPMMMPGMMMPQMGGMTGMPGGVQAVPLNMMNEAQLRAALGQQGKSQKGDKAALLARLIGASGAAPAAKKQKKERKPLTQEQIDKMPEEHRTNYLKKQAKKKENAAKQQQMLEQHFNEATQRQERSVVVKIDLQEIRKQVEQALGAYGPVDAIKYDSLKNEYVVRYQNKSDARKATKGASVLKPKNATVTATVLIQPQIVNTKTVFFVDPTYPNHPAQEQVNGILDSNGVDKNNRWPGKQASEVFQNGARQEFSKFGNVNGVFRERGFICVVFTSNAAARKAAQGAETVLGVPLGTVQVGIPKKKHKRQAGELCGSKRKREEVDDNDVEMNTGGTSGGKAVW